MNGLTNKNKRRLQALAAVAALGFYLTPYLAVQRIRHAAAAQDLVRLAGWVDFPALRASLKHNLQAGIASRSLTVQGQPTPASALGAAVAGALLGPMVDALITPASLSRLLQGQAPAGAVVASGRLNTSTAPGQLQTHMAYEGFNHFVLSISRAGDGDDDQPVALVLQRDGLFSWKLADLRLN